jgi:hypothetical protein
MDQFYKATIRISFEDKKGNEKFRKESYIVSAMSPTDVEAKLAKHLGTADYEVVSISTTNIVEIVK